MAMVQIHGPCRRLTLIRGGRRNKVICNHCGVEGKKVETCETYKGPHLCPNDHIDHSRPDLFCKKCQGLLTAGVCNACEKISDNPEYKAYQELVILELEKILGEKFKGCFKEFDCLEGFIEKEDPEEVAINEVYAMSD